MESFNSKRFASSQITCKLAVKINKSFIFVDLFRLSDVWNLVREVYQSEVIVKSKSALYKKSQHLLHSMLKKMFPQEGFQ